MGSKVFVIIVTYNGLKWIDKCLKSLQSSDYGHQVLIIDNCSTDNTVKHIQEHYPTVKLLPQDTNLGFGRANNIGIASALEQGADYFFLLNQDAYVEPETLSELVAAFRKAYDHTGIISPVHKAENGTLDFGFKDHISRYTPEVARNSILGGEKGLYEVGFVNAACWMLSRATIELVGAFNPLFPHYGEDNDFVNRLKFHGLQVRVLTTTYITHDRAQSHAKSFTKMKMREEVAFIKHLANINVTFNIAFFYALEKYCKEVIYYFFTLSWKRVLAIKLGFLKMFIMFGKIKQSRIISKEEGAYL